MGAFLPALHVCMYVCIMYVRIYVHTVYCKLFEAENFHGWTRYFKFAGKLSRFVHPGQKCAHVHTQFY